MADTFKSFDDLYREVAGKEPPSKSKPSKSEGAVKMDHKKRTQLLSDPKRGRNSYGSGQKKKKNKKKNANSESKWQKKQRKQSVASIQKREKERQELIKARSFKQSISPLASVLRCPTHGNILSTGVMARLSSEGDPIRLYFCKSCNCFYCNSKSVESKGTLKIHDYEVRYIHAPSYSANTVGMMSDTKTVREKFDECVKASGIDLLKTNEPNVTFCKKCSNNISSAYEKDVITINFFDDSTRNVSGAYCEACGAITISMDRLRSLEKYCNADYIKSITTKRRRVVNNADVIKAQSKFDPKTTVLYIHRGKIRCLDQIHNVISVTLRIPSCIDTSSVVINANYCFNCDRFFISADEYEYYRSIYPIMLIHFEYISGDGALHNLADKSPLMLAGYTVRANSRYTDAQRRTILKNVIQLGILRKHEVINYLNYFISMNGKAGNMDAAVSKWKSDLEYVRAHDFETQNKGYADSVRKWR